MQLTAPKVGQKSRFSYAANGLDSLSLASLACRLNTTISTTAGITTSTTQTRKNTPLVIVTSSAFEAQRLLEEIPYFAPGLSVRLLPDWETLPYDVFSPHPDLISERLATLYQISQNQCDVVIVPIATALIRLPALAYLAGHSFMLKKNQQLNLEAQIGRAHV